MHMQIQIQIQTRIQIQKTLQKNRLKTPRFATLTDCSDAAGAITAPILFHGKVAAHHQNYHHGHNLHQNYHHGHHLFKIIILDTICIVIIINLLSQSPGAHACTFRIKTRRQCAS